MGMYDSIYLDIRCPQCGDLRRNEAQTGDLDCSLTSYEVGDYITEDHTNLDCIAQCENCNAFFDLDIEIIDGFVSGGYKTILT